MHIGAAVTSHVERSGDTLTMAPTTITGLGPCRVAVRRVEGDTLQLKSSDIQQTFTRVGPAPPPLDLSSADGSPSHPPTHSSDPNFASQQKLVANALFVFSSDNTQSVRIPFTAKEGTWNATAHTFQLNGDTIAYSFKRTGAKLSLGQPPDGSKTDTYLPDPIL